MAAHPLVARQDDQHSPRTSHVYGGASDGSDVLVRSGTARVQIPRGTIEAAYALGRKSNALSPAQIRAANLDGFDASYLVGMLNAIGADRD